jgi:hypothetical protein
MSADDLYDAIKGTTNKKNKKMDELEIKYVDPSTIQHDVEEDEYDDYTTNEHTEDVSFVEFAIINSYFHDLFVKKETKDISVKMYGDTDNIGRISIGGSFTNIDSFWFNCTFVGDDNDCDYDDDEVLYSFCRMMYDIGVLNMMYIGRCMAL